MPFSLFSVFMCNPEFVDHWNKPSYNDWFIYLFLTSYFLILKRLLQSLKWSYHHLFLIHILLSDFKITCKWYLSDDSCSDLNLSTKQIWMNLSSCMIIYINFLLISFLNVRKYGYDFITIWILWYEGAIQMFCYSEHLVLCLWTGWRCGSPRPPQNPSLTGTRCAVCCSHLSLPRQGTRCQALHI